MAKRSFQSMSIGLHVCNLDRRRVFEMQTISRKYVKNEVRYVAPRCVRVAHRDAAGPTARGGKFRKSLRLYSIPPIPY